MSSMNKQPEEENIRELFQQLRREDEQSAPSFADDWNAAWSRSRKPDYRWGGWRLAAAAAALILLGAGWLIFFRRPMKTQAPMEIVKSDVPAPVAPPLLLSPSTTFVNHRPNFVRRQRSYVRPRPAAVSISRWHSPTEFLLRAPGEQLFKSVPRWDESVVNIKAILPDQKN
jgi:hypothetical protein